MRPKRGSLEAANRRGNAMEAALALSRVVVAGFMEAGGAEAVWLWCDRACADGAHWGLLRSLNGCDDDEESILGRKFQNSMPPKVVTYKQT
ncbi:uncharacterized protein A4U43_C08F22820 [Asparagus officinalis]|nr:uncharacterized protein A4U43_C08F22820 [Asparagus officinalis]